MQLTSILAFLSTCGLLLSCGGSAGSAPTEPDPARPTSVSISPLNATVDAFGATVQFAATVRDQWYREMADATVTWSSSDAEVASMGSSGLATAVGNGTATILAAASESAFGLATMTVAFTPIAITTPSLPPGVVGLEYSQVFQGEGVSTPAWSVSAGALPPGLTLDPGTGAMTGTPTAPGTSTFTITLSDAGQTAHREYSLVVVPGDFGIGLGDDQFSLIPAGSFQMGSLNGDEDEQPVHTVNITQAFRLQKTEVTQHQWKSVMGSLPAGVSLCGETCPIAGVSLNDVRAFVDTLNAREPETGYRLPTEAEWEYAARAGTTGDYGGTGALEDMGWYAGNSGGKVHFVAEKEANAWGLYDMHGNVMEWVQDYYLATYYAISPTDDPPGPGPTASGWVIRGGAAHLPAAEARSANRSHGVHYAVYTGSGFRLARKK